jgi:endonuclease/exonuclease/phosphatase family metal-dependent hydrolase
MWDVAPDAGPVTYDNFSVNTPAPPYTGPETNSVIRVLTYNIHFGVDPSTGMVDTQRAADLILAQGADLVCLNEVDRFKPRSDNRDLIGEISAKTGLSYVFSNNIASSGNAEYGNAILSKYPILFRDHRLLPRLGSNEQRGWLKAIVDVNGKFISFWATHLASVGDDTERLMCVTNFNSWIGDETLPVIFCGDFNETPDKNVHDVMELKWDDNWLIAGSGLGRTVPSPGPAMYRIDYIWKAKGTPLQPTNASVPYTIEASDHFPVVMDFVLTNATNHASGFNFPFNQGSGTKVTDSVAGLSGKFGTDAPTWSTNVPTGLAGDFSLYFDGTRSVTVPDPAQLVGTNGLNGDYTLQAWVRLPLNFVPSQRMILFQYERRPGFSFSINTNRTLHTTTFKLKDISSSAAVPNDGQWHHVAVVHTDGVGMKFYIDATLAATVAYTNGAGLRTSSAITIGAASEGANAFTGYLDRLRFDNHALAPAQFDFPAITFANWAAWYHVSDPDADADGDGQSNLAEYTANTNPTNAASVFKALGGTRFLDGSFVLTWASVGGKRYRVQSTDSLGVPFTDIVRDVVSETDSNPPGQPSVQSFTDNTLPPGGVRYYRIKVVP